MKATSLQWTSPDNDRSAAGRIRRGEHRSLRSCETQTEEDKERAGCSIEPLRNRFVCPQSFAKSGSKPREHEAPDCAGGHKCETEHQKRQHFDVRCRVDELRKKREKKERHFRI
jgi:hypothetical protein